MIVCQSAPPASSPPPRLRARSMLSSGTEFLRAFWIASYSVGLPSGSPPPVRAATSMFLISLANSLPRLASSAAFLCLVVAHLEWPLIRSVFLSHARSGRADHVAEQAVHPAVTGQLRVEGGGEHWALPYRHDPTGGRSCRLRLGHSGQHLHPVAGPFHPRRPDEHRVHGLAADPGQVEVGLEGVDLAAEGVAPHRDVQ